MALKDNNSNINSWFKISSKFLTSTFDIQTVQFLESENNLAESNKDIAKVYPVLEAITITDEHHENIPI